MKRFAGFLILTFLTGASAFSQDSIPTTDSVKIQVAADALLPTHYPLTQRLLWGEKGLMRNFDSFKLSEESRELELDIRDKMFTAHRYLGYATFTGLLLILPSARFSRLLL